MEINEALLKEKLADLAKQEQRIQDDFKCIQGAKQLALHLLDLMKKEVLKAEDVVVAGVVSADQKLESK